MLSRKERGIAKMKERKRRRKSLHPPPPSFRLGYPEKGRKMGKGRRERGRGRGGEADDFSSFCLFRPPPPVAGSHHRRSMGHSGTRPTNDWTTQFEEGGALAHTKVYQKSVLCRRLVAADDGWPFFF